MSFPREVNDVLDTVGIYKGCFTKEYFEREFLESPHYEHDRHWYYRLKPGSIWVNGSWRNERKKYRLERSNRFCRNMNRRELYREGTSESFLMLCMSEERDVTVKKVALEESLLWAHYAEGGRGMRIGIDFDDSFCDFLHKVKYSSQMVSGNLSVFKANMSQEERDRLARRFRWATRTTKSLAWRYEHEVRLVFEPDEPYLKVQRGLHFFPLSKDAVWRVDFGPLCFKNEAAFLRKVKKLREMGYDKTLFRFAEPDLDVYGFRYRSEYYIGKGVATARACGHPNSFIYPDIQYDDESWPIGRPYPSGF